MTGRKVATLKRITPDHIRQFQAELQHSGAMERTRAGVWQATQSIYFRSLKTFFRWMLTERLIPMNPMEGLRGPSVKVTPTPLVADDDLRTLTRSITGSTLTATRDVALLRILLVMRSTDAPALRR